MRAVKMPGDGSVSVIETTVPEPGEHQVLVATKASAICRSDMSILHGSPLLGPAERERLITPGHEAAGIVARVGSGVTQVKVGDRVAGYLAAPAPGGRYAERGYPMLDVGWRCLGFDIDGGDADYFVLDETCVLPLPSSVTFEAGAVLTDMVGTQFATQRRMGISEKSTVVVSGVGPMGAAAVLVAKGFGARVIALDVQPSRIAYAQSLGADVTIDASVSPVESVRELTDGFGAEYVVECSGHPGAQAAAFAMVAPLGTIAIVGESSALEINPSRDLIHTQATVIGAWYFPTTAWPALLEFVAARDIDVERLISNRWDLDDAAQAFSEFDRGNTEKSVFVWR